ncbi:MAG TPA: thioredoxin fold domain-containing protein [Sphingobacteriaceae bacterium]
MIRLLIFVSVFLANQIQAQVKPVRFEQLETLQKEEEKLILVLIETDWCKYCHAMKYAIRNDKKLSEVLNKKFYTVFLNAESMNNIEFGGKRFGFRPTGLNTGVHELAEQLGTVNGQLTFPTLCFLNRKNEIIFQYSGFLDSVSLLKMLNTLLLNK